jgi:predicted DNA-binding transcriptional regulator YafY
MFSDGVTLRDAWVVAAVEHRTMKIRYYSGAIKDEITDREVEPDFIVTTDHWKDFGCWVFCRLRNQIRVFNVQGILDWELTQNEFNHNPMGRWRELVPNYLREKKIYR